jgi:hypothetical protein
VGCRPFGNDLKWNNKVAGMFPFSRLLKVVCPEVKLIRRELSSESLCSPWSSYK